jgi:hypothetical protein
MRLLIFLVSVVYFLFTSLHLIGNKLRTPQEAGDDDRHLVLCSATRLVAILFSALISIIQLNLSPLHFRLFPLNRGALAPAASRGYPGFVVIGAQPVRCLPWPQRPQQVAATPGVG